MDIGALLPCLQPPITQTRWRPCSRSGAALLVMTGRVTLLGLSRWAGSGGRDQTVPRLFAPARPWATLCWVFWRQPVSRAEEVSLLAGDEVVTPQAGPHPHGLARFLASLAGKPVPGRAFGALSWVRPPQRRAFPLRVEQGVRRAAANAARKAPAAATQPAPATAQRRPGRPKGRQNTPPAGAPLPPECARIPGMSTALLHRLAGLLPWRHVVLDGPCGNPTARQRARPCALPLLAQLRYDAALSLPYPGRAGGRGPRRP
jgi:putative transposase